jgi:transposase
MDITKLPYYKTYKTKLKNVVKKETTLDTIENLIITNNFIVTHTYQFIKLYLIDYYEKSQKLPVLDTDFIVNVMKTIATIKDNTGRPPSQETKVQRQHFKDFYESHYKSLLADTKPLYYTGLNTVLDYNAVSILTMIENNIKQHYVEYVERYVNVAFENDKTFENTKDKYAFLRILRNIKNDLLSITKTLKSPQEYHKWIEEHKCFVLPQKSSFEKDSIYYDIQVNPQDYYSCMFYMMKVIEAKEKTIYNVCPLRSNIIPKHTTIDTTTILNYFGVVEGNKRFYLTNGNLVKYKKIIWSWFFKTKDKIFRDKKNYAFNGMIETDGVSVSLLFIRKDKEGKRNLRQPKFKTEETYISDVKPKELKELSKKKIVAFDPNLSDLLFGVCNVEGKCFDKLRYTQNQRRKETKSKKYSKITDALKKETLIEGKSIKEWEASLSKYNKKTLNFENFKEYIKHKNFVNHITEDFYESYLHRKLKLNAYNNIKRCEAKFINRLEKLFGKPNEVVTGIGDFEQHQHRKFKEPVKGKGLRTLLRKHGYDVYLVDEHKTSCTCHNCHGRCETFRYCQNPRPWKQEQTIKRHGLVMCQTCHSIWNRDVNASLNIYEIMKSHIEKRKRPEHLLRSNQ